jgi:hypothetical protein
MAENIPEWILGIHTNPGRPSNRQQSQRAIVVALRAHGLTRERRVCSFRTKEITFSADENLISRATLIARAQHKILNAAFREGLVQFADSSGNAQSFDALMKRLKRVDAGKHFRREELNERKIISE